MAKPHIETQDRTSGGGQSIDTIADDILDIETFATSDTLAQDERTTKQLYERAIERGETKTKGGLYRSLARKRSLGLVESRNVLEDGRWTCAWRKVD